MVSRALESGFGSSSATAIFERSSQVATFPSSAPEPPRASSSCVATIQRFARTLGLSSGVTTQLLLCRRQSSQQLYQHCWECCRSWCHNKGHSISSTSVAKIADFLYFLHLEKHLYVSAIKGYRSTLSVVFKFCLLELVNSFVLCDLVRFFELQHPQRPVRAPSWDLVKVLTYHRGPVFEPLHTISLGFVMMKVAFLLALATAKRVGELQALSVPLAFLGLDLSVSHLLEFVAKTESERNPLPCSFLVRSLLEFVGNLSEECLLCPVCVVCIYLDLTKDLSPRPRALFVSPHRPLRSMSENALSFFIRTVIVDAGASSEGSSPPRAHSVLGIATSAAFLKNWSISKVLEVATWRSNPVFAAFYFRDLSFSLDGCHSLSPFVAAGLVLAQ